MRSPRRLTLVGHRSLAAAFACLTLGVHSAFAELIRDVCYGEATGERLLLDVHVPDGAGPHPIAILVHGGGWMHGDKAGSDHPGDGADISPWFTTLTAANFTWFSLNYRLAPQHRWPACLEDVRAAIRWIKAHASEYRGDPEHIALFGHSAGGQIVCLLATLDTDADTRVAAVVGYAPVTDLPADVATRGGVSTSLQAAFGLPANPTPAALDRLRDASPIAHVRAGLPPFLLVHGDADKTVPYQQSLAFQARLRSAGVRCDLLTIPGGPHGLLTWQTLAPDYSARVVSWLESVFAANSTSSRSAATATAR